MLKNHNVEKQTQESNKMSKNGLNNIEEITGNFADADFYEKPIKTSTSSESNSDINEDNISEKDNISESNNDKLEI